MPIYEYECSRCAHRIEILQKISDAPLEDCPACGKPSLRKLVSAASFRLKGTGWYETDFKNKDKPKPAEKQAESDSTKSETKSDASTSEGKSASESQPKSGEKSSEPPKT
uniref:Putative regulatory protein, FmdB family n=1 Tax=Candidatus Kentrum eta TaxID=2126337 RepID=A0A450UCW5_9GAMM|nr:MAG: putative regulatory protein, FmdB family [Candidatus Kentron sp. H]VFJ90246.1 MAG: putative regulatory protein, FmdB family [Candidatus Kentron sp. H]VFJ96603.1 MAG: putative regulatory protein, FmdB family [Candidatus Kentron sp. H]